MPSMAASTSRPTHNNVPTVVDRHEFFLFTV
jgi:hypothetical protein